MAKASIAVTLDTRVLSRAAELTNQTLGNAVQQLADEIVEDARANCPRSTLDGADYVHLQDTIEAEVIGELEIDVHDGKEYGIFVEAGSRGTPARPFLTPAVEKAKGRLPELVAEALENLWRGAGAH